MRYFNLLLILVIFGCYSGVHTSNFNATEQVAETAPSCHTSNSVQMTHSRVPDFNIQSKNVERKSCCIEAVNYQIDYESISLIITASIFSYYSLQSNIQNIDNIRDNNLNNHSPPKLFISKSSFLI